MQGVLQKMCRKITSKKAKQLYGRLGEEFLRAAVRAGTAVLVGGALKRMMEKPQQV